MLFRKSFLEGIRSGAITLAFRRWQRPSVRAGGSLLTPIGQLDIESVERVSSNRITAADARRAGYESRELLLQELQQRTQGEIYRIELGSLRPDPRVALRKIPATTGSALRSLRDGLRRLDARAIDGGWTLRTLEVLSAHPGVRAGDLCARVGQDREQFKRNVRKLKKLGLTESLGTGYQLSPRGKAILGSLLSDRDESSARE